MRNTQRLISRAAALRDGGLNAPLTIRFTRRDHDRLVAFAREHGVSAGDIVRVAVRRTVGRNERPGKP